MTIIPHNPSCLFSEIYKVWHKTTNMKHRVKIEITTVVMITEAKF